jgi:hypothetical protein
LKTLEAVLRETPAAFATSMRRATTTPEAGAEDVSPNLDRSKFFVDER